MSTMTLKVLSDAEIETLNEKTLDVFERVGIKITHDEVLAKLKKAGADVNEATGLVKLPRKLVQELLDLAPSVSIETGLNGKPLHVGQNNRYFLSLILDPYIVDYEKGLRRPVLDDVRRHTIIGESLDRVSAMMRMQFPVEDVAESDNYYKTMEMFLCHTTKHISAYPVSRQNTLDWIEAMNVIAAAAGCPREGLMTLASAVTSPLQLHGPNVDIIKLGIEHGCSIVTTVCPMAGTTSPYSVSGTALIANVETLIPVLIAQLYKPGHPVYYCVGPSITDMKSGHDLYYSPEKMLFKIIGNQMGRFYKLPIAGEAGGALTWRPDVQNGAESFAYLLASFTAGQNLIGGLGSLHNANGMGAEQIIMQCALAVMAEFVSRGVDTSDLKLGLDAVSRVGPGGNYLTDPLTMDLLRSDEFFSNNILDRTGGYIPNAPSMLENAHQKALDLVDNYMPTVPDNVIEAVKRHFAEKYQNKNTGNLGWQ